MSAQAFPEENAAVQLQLVTAAVKLFLKAPQPRAQQMIQLVLTYATQARRRSLAWSSPLSVPLYGAKSLARPMVMAEVELLPRGLIRQCAAAASSMKKGSVAHGWACAPDGWPDLALRCHCLPGIKFGSAWLGYLLLPGCLIRHHAVA
jgi:hypothetical protein